MTAIGTAGKKVELLIKQGSDFLAPFQAVDASTGLPRDITGATVRAQIRKTVLSADITAAFTCLLDTDPTTGKFTIGLSALTTAAITAGETPWAKESLYVWDAVLVSQNGFVSPLAWGAVRIHPDVTR